LSISGELETEAEGSNIRRRWQGETSDKEASFRGREKRRGPKEVEAQGIMDWFFNCQAWDFQPDASENNLISLNKGFLVNSIMGMSQPLSLPLSL